MVQARQGLWIYHAEGWLEGGYVHISAVERARLQTLTDVQQVEYEIERSPNGKTSATSLTVRG